MNKNKFISYSAAIVLNSLAVFWIVLFIVIFWYGTSMNAYEGDYNLMFTNWEQTLVARMDIVLSVWLLLQLAGLAMMNFVVYAFRHNQHLTTLWIVIFTLIVVVIPFMAAAVFPIDWMATIIL